MNVFEVWEARDVPSEWGPYASWTRSMLDLIETGYHIHPTLGGWRDQ